jgi:hypothetical protein
MTVRRLTSKEKEMIAVALNMRKCYIETGSISLGASDVQRMGTKTAKEQFGAEIKALSEDQMQLILGSHDLERKMYNDQIYIDE